MEEVDHVLEEAIARLSETLAERRRTLRSSWQTTPAQPAAGGGTPAAGVAPGGALATEGAPAPEDWPPTPNSTGWPCGTTARRPSACCGSEPRAPYGRMAA